MLFRKKKANISTIGIIIDQPLKDFKKSLEEQKTNVGTMNNLILYLNGAYADLRQRKDTLMKTYENEETSTREKKRIKKAVKDIYAELTKIEEKVLFLQDKVNGLLNLEGEIDSTK